QGQVVEEVLATYRDRNLGILEGLGQRRERQARHREPGGDELTSFHCGVSFMSMAWRRPGTPAPTHAKNRCPPAGGQHRRKAPLRAPGVTIRYRDRRYEWRISAWCSPISCSRS